MLIGPTAVAPAREVFTDGYDEVRDDAGRPRYGYESVLAVLEAIDLEAATEEIATGLSGDGVDFGQTPFVVDPVPRIIGAAEWDPLARGLRQRARALNEFLLDAYGTRRIVQAGRLPAEIIDQAEGFEPDLVGRLPGDATPAAIMGLDVVRDPTGAFVVLEDNLRTPSGYAYALAARTAVSRVLAGATRLPRPRPLLGPLSELLATAVRGAAPDGNTDPSVVVLTDGPSNVAYYEHALAARLLEAPLVTIRELERAGSGLRVRLPNGRSRDVDVVYRRTDEDRLRAPDGSLTRVAAALFEPWVMGSVGVVNAFGTGVADDKLVHAYVEHMIGFYLDEEPLVRSVPTHALTEPGPRDAVRDRLREVVVKPRGGHGGIGVFVGAHANVHDLQRIAGELERNPERFVAQPTIALSRHATVIDGRMQPRHVDLRPFVFCAADEAEVLPGGLTRVALDAGALVVNSSQNGGGKDTWVLD